MREPTASCACPAVLSAAPDATTNAPMNSSLANKRIVITRAPEQARTLTQALESLGAEVFLLPAVAFAPPDDLAPLDRVLNSLSEFDWVLFTSQNAVRFFSQRLKALGKTRELAGGRVAAVGPATAQAAAEEGFEVNYVAKSHTGESLAHELRESLAGRRVLLPRSDSADDRLPSLLREIGVDVTEAIAYRTIAPSTFDPAILSRIRRAQVDAIVFASPSAYHNLRNAIGATEMKTLSARIAFTAIGPTTARALESSGVRPAIEAAEASAEGIAAAIEKHFQSQSAAARRP